MNQQTGSGTFFWSKTFFPTLVFSCITIGLFPSLASATACEPAANGDYTVTADCAFSGTTDGIDNGNITINPGATLTLNAGQVLIINPGKGITINGSIAINATAQIKKGYLWMTDADADGWPANTNQILQDVAPANGRRKYLMASATVSDCNDAAYSLANDCSGGGGGEGVGACLVTTPLPSTIVNHSAVAYNGYIYTTGGVGGGVATSSVFYAPISTTSSVGVWKTTTPLPQKIRSHSAVVYNGYIYTTGGVDSVGAGNPTAAVFFAPINAIDHSVGAWQATTPMPKIIWGHSAVVRNGYIYVTGGVSGGMAVANATSTVYFAPISAVDHSVGAWQTTTPLPQQLFVHSAVVNNGFIYTTGGDKSGMPTSTVYFAPISATNSVGAWKTTAQLPAGLWNHSAVVNNGFIYTTGGGEFIPSPTVYFAPISATSSIGAWQTTTMSKGLYSHSSVVYNGNIYTTGGVGVGTGFPFITAATSTVSVCPITATNSGGGVGAWTTTTPLPAVMRYHSVVTNNGFIYSIGGIGGAAELFSTTTVNFAQISTTSSVSAWAKTTPLPVGTRNHSAVVYNSYIYTTGGADTSGDLTSAVYFAPISATNSVSAWAETTPLPNAIAGHSAAVYNGYIYTAGGYDINLVRTAAVYFAPISAVNRSVGAWTATTPLPHILNGHSEVINNGYIYITGGYDSTMVTSTVYFAPISATNSVGAWAKTTPLPKGIYNHSSVVNNGFIYTIGGSDSAITGVRTSTVYYAPISATSSVGAWKTTTKLPIAIGDTRTVVNNGFIYSIGGVNNSDANIKTVYFAPLQ
ncbi:MAG: hypothetical protein A3B25_02365 [Candidatus Ryanbacteria bacterium RIFCSPLOWO2_01_FULL_48_26]|uniref:Uncharacterized protein n=1 Tax=Candidatus Ryanbacteria bacterium RIFCSPLOWO2_01_FULL_48_26 TaxID=1802126 RepID=A0A1G2GQV5_9BACT|nr:MAG: hypothetical protein A3B25_02365 [Candidatus Ryanbacteria bacterium RIFCSPLOWO2_01_FULL_48_26]